MGINRTWNGLHIDAFNVMKGYWETGKEVIECSNALHRCAIEDLLSISSVQLGHFRALQVMGVIEHLLAK
jgi:hypothetical protein